MATIDFPSELDGVEIPHNVPHERVVDVDMFDLNGIEDGYHEAWVRSMAPGARNLMWTPRNGGHWIATNFETIREIYLDPSRFSSEVIFMPKEAGEKYEMVPTRMDPPEHTPYRKGLTGALGTAMVRRFDEKARIFSKELIDGIIDQGSCDFAKDYAEKFPVLIFMALADLPLSDVPKLTRFAHLMTRPDGNTPAERAAVLEEGNKGFFAYVDPIVKARRGSKADDLISLMVNLDIDGEPISHDHAVGLVSLLLLAGLDTVVAFLNFAMIYLARNPDKVAEIRSDPKKIASGAEELFRRFPVISEARMIAKDQEYDGVALKQGEMVLLPTALAGLDETVYPDPWNVDFTRKGAPHLTFGGGVHRCAGALFARLELVTTLEEWLKRIPEFSLQGDIPIGYASGIVANVTNVPLVWPVALK